jgi:hypothetical protein
MSTEIVDVRADPAALQVFVVVHPVRLQGEHARVHRANLGSLESNWFQPRLEDAKAR